MAHAPRDEQDPAPTAAPSWPDVVRRLLLHARYLGASREEAEDLVHDTLELVVRDPDWFDPNRGDLVGALKVVLRNRYLNRIRSRSVRQRAAPRLRVVQGAPGPDLPLAEADSRDNRRAFLSLLTPDERQLFAAWTAQRSGRLPGPEAARSVGLDHRAYEAAKKRLRRRCRAILDELGLAPADLFDPPRSGETP